MEAVEGHIEQYFGKVENVFHELVSPDIHVDICIVPPTEERDYYTLVTMGMGAHRMNVPEELAEYKLERAELAIALPADWKLVQESMQDERWYWPIRLLKVLARLPIASDTWLGFGHTMDNKENFAENTKLCAAILTGPQSTEEGGEVCTLPGGEEVNFYQVIPLYEDELDYKLEHDVDALLDKMAGISFVVNPTRQDAITRGTLSNDDFDGEMDDASYHIESIEEKELPIAPINAYNHMAIYLRWCMEHDLMGEEFLAEYGEVVEKVKADSASVDLREFIRDELDGCLSVSYTHLLERDEGLDVLDILKNEYVPEHPVMDLGEMIELMKEEVMLGSDFSQIDFLFDNTAMALAELYFQWKDNGKLDYDHEEAIWDKVRCV